MSFDALLSLADRAALFSALQRDALRMLLAPLGEHRWNADVAAGTLTFSSVADPARTVTAKTELIATVAPAAGTVLWGWAHPQGSPTGLAGQLRAHGEQSDIPVLAQAEIPFPSTATEGWVENAAFVIGLAAAEITGVAPQFVAPLTSGTRAVLLLDAGLVRPTVAGAISALPHVLASAPLRDGRTAVWGLGRLAGWSLEWSDAAHSSARVSDATGSAVFHFDAESRITGVRVEESSAGAPSPALPS